jgi:hypothetical protein
MVKILMKVMIVLMKNRSDSPNSMDVEINSLHSNPDNEDFKAFCEEFPFKEKLGQGLPTHGEDFFKKDSMNEIIHLGDLAPGHPSHNDDVIEYEDQAAKEAYRGGDESPCKKRLSKLKFKNHLGKLKFKVLPNKRISLRDINHEVKRIEIFLPFFTNK